MRLYLCTLCFISGYCLRGTAACCLLLPYCEAPVDSCGKPCIYYNVFDFITVLFLAAMRVLLRQTQFGALRSSLIKKHQKAASSS